MRTLPDIFTLSEVDAIVAIRSMLPNKVELPEGDLQISFIKASGPGGQNVNKVASAVQLRFDLAGTTALSERVKSRLRALAGHRLTSEGAILIVARNHRTQEQNRREALARLEDLIARARVEPKVRKATQPTQASKQRRLQGKAHRQQTKSMRRPVRRWEE